MPRRQEPLAELRVFEMWNMLESASADVLVAIFEHCPNVINLRCPGYSNDDDVNTPSAALAWCCTKLQDSIEFRILERLYWQIGQLTELEYLDLRTDVKGGLWLPDGVSWREQYKKTSFPGLFTLAGWRTGRFGYLHLLSGLKKLEVLQGSVYADTPAAEATMDVRELVWIEENWLVLRSAEFY
ncbi:hypothetical protein BGX23_008443 [Mortierella sp. AD031]|nr:hypothetical protein BGX23_008443 [Mortierella sp. AD031]